MNGFEKKYIVSNVKVERNKYYLQKSILNLCAFASMNIE